MNIPPHASHGPVSLDVRLGRLEDVELQKVGALGLAVEEHFSLTLPVLSASVEGTTPQGDWVLVGRFLLPHMFAFQAKIGLLGSDGKPIVKIEHGLLPTTFGLRVVGKRENLVPMAAKAVDQLLLGESELQRTKRELAELRALVKSAVDTFAPLIEMTKSVSSVPGVAGALNAYHALAGALPPIA